MNNNPSHKLSNISHTLSGIGQRATDLLRQISGMPTSKELEAKAQEVRPRYTGSSRRLSDAEEDAIVKMLDDGYSVQFIASEFAVSRPAIYGVRDRRRPEMHKRIHA